VHLASTGTNSLFMTSLGSGSDSVTVDGTGAGAGLQLLGQGGSDNITIDFARVRRRGAGRGRRGGRHHVPARCAGQQRRPLQTATTATTASPSAPRAKRARRRARQHRAGRQRERRNADHHALGHGQREHEVETRFRPATRSRSSTTGRRPPDVAYSLSPTQFHARVSSPSVSARSRRSGSRARPGSNAFTVPGTPDSSTTTFAGGPNATTMTVGSTGASSKPRPEPAAVRATPSPSTGNRRVERADRARRRRAADTLHASTGRGAGRGPRASTAARALIRTP